LVPVVDLSRRGERFVEIFTSAARRVTLSGRFLLGPELETFEHRWRDYTGAAESVAVSSGASALQLGLEAVGAAPGREVIVPGFTAVPTVSAVVATGARPVFVDVDPATACLDLDAASSAVSSRTAAVVVVHLYGYPSDVPSVSVPVIEDAAQAHGGLRDVGRSSLTAYSFYPTKNLGGIGDGGAVVTNDTRLADYVRLCRVHGMSAKYVHDAIAQNHRMSELEAAWLTAALESLDADVSRRRAIGNAYRAAAPELRWQKSDGSHAYHLCVFRHDRREHCREVLAAAGVGSAVHYPLALTQQPAYRHLATSACPNSELWAAECISVPCFPEMTDSEVAVVCDALTALDPGSSTKP
jgi:dTDP-3-amino-3,4,6-trideoxy-alpha-D-glucose transaminase